MATSLAIASTSARAEEVKGPISLSAETAVVSDYRFRGISLSGGKPAIQGGLYAEHSSGLYGGLWSSTIRETVGGARAELDLQAGYAGTVLELADIDVAATYYAYPSDPALNYFEVSSEVSIPGNSITPRLGLSYVPPQPNVRDEQGRKRDNFYIFAGLDLSLPIAPITLTTQVGREAGALDLVERGGKWDWQVGVSVEVHGATLSAAYTDSNATVRDDRGRNLARGTIVGSLLFNL